LSLRTGGPDVIVRAAIGPPNGIRRMSDNATPKNLRAPALFSKAFPTDRMFVIAPEARQSSGC
jgi:hypothetical protein